MNPYVVERAEWMAEGVCLSVDGEVFFPGEGGNPEPAKRICRGCPVVEQCRAFAVARPELEGVWGATSERQRIRMRRGTGKVRTPAPVPHGTSAGYRAHYRADTVPCDACRSAEALRRRGMSAAS